MSLKTDYLNYVAPDTGVEYNLQQKSVGIYSITDVTTYEQVGSNWSAEVINATNDYVNKNSIPIYTHTRSGTVNQFVGDANATVFQFICTASILAGDTFTVNGVTRSVLTENGQPLMSQVVYIDRRYIASQYKNGNFLIVGAYNTRSETNFDDHNTLATSAGLKAANDNANTRMPIGGGQFNGYVYAPGSNRTNTDLKNILVRNNASQDVARNSILFVEV